jgi:hypothetical protein
VYQGIRFSQGQRFLVNSFVLLARSAHLGLCWCAGVALSAKPSLFSLMHLAGTRERELFGSYFDTARRKRITAALADPGF